MNSSLGELEDGHHDSLLDRWEEKTTVPKLKKFNLKKVALQNKSNSQKNDLSSLAHKSSLSPSAP